MNEPLSEVFTVGGKSNSLGRAAEVLDAVLNDCSLIEKLYDCLFDDDPWVRMRAVDTLEKVCRVHPEWLQPYIGRLLSEVVTDQQASIQWHLAQIFREIELRDDERQTAMIIMKRNIATIDVDWIVACNTMETLVEFAQKGHVSVSEINSLLVVQQSHRSNAVVKRATKLRAKLNK